MQNREPLFHRLRIKISKLYIKSHLIKNDRNYIYIYLYIKNEIILSYLHYSKCIILLLVHHLYLFITEFVSNSKYLYFIQKLGRIITRHYVRQKQNKTFNKSNCVWFTIFYEY